LEGTPLATTMITTPSLDETYWQPTPVAPEGRSAVSPASLVGEPTVTPRALLTVVAEGHEVALAAAAPLEVEAGAEVAAAALELDDAAEEDDDGELEVPQAASAAAAISPIRSEGSVTAETWEWAPPS